jgi:putative methyltransferase (TIGR04325 family)
VVAAHPVALGETERMNPRMKAVLKPLLPARLRAAWRHWRTRGWFTGDYANWAAAEAASDGYDSAGIAHRVLEATQAVRLGRAAFERDSVQFAEPVAEPGLEAAWTEVLSARPGPLRVIDFGGSLGSTYWRHRGLFGDRKIEWEVVEQPAWVTLGREHLADTPLRFHENVAAARSAASGPVDVLLASTSLQYLEHPWAALDDWMRWAFPFILLNNLPLHRDRPHRLMVQRVPASIYRASYPVWLFNREEFLAHVRPHYDVRREFAAEAVWPIGGQDYPSTGLLLARRAG